MSKQEAAKGTSHSRSSSRTRTGRRKSPRKPKATDRSPSDHRASPGSWNVDRGRSRTRRQSNPFSEDSLRRRGYHSLFSAFGKVFHVEKRWKMIRDMGSGAYGVVISAADDISGETVAIKLVCRVFEKLSLAKRALREVTLLRHFSNHENITGLIDVDAISPDFNEIYLFMEPMEADLHQIIKSGQILTNEHIQYFVYQILRGMKYIHSASVVHRDLKPGNLLVNADCELKICDFGLSRGFDAAPDESATHMTEYVATRWYRAPEIMLAFRRYDTAIDVWSIGCILGELLLGKPLFKGKDYVDQLNKILDILGTPDETVLKRIGSEKAQAYVRSLPIRKTVPFQKLVPAADVQAIDLLAKMLAFDPQQRITVPEALEHPWLSSYHDINDEPECPVRFEKWRDIEKLETIDEFREALWNEIEEYRMEVRGINFNLSPQPLRSTSTATNPSTLQEKSIDQVALPRELLSPPETTAGADTVVIDVTDEKVLVSSPERQHEGLGASLRPSIMRRDSLRPPSPTPSGMENDPVVTYARRSTILNPHQSQRSTSPLGGARTHIGQPSYSDSQSTTVVDKPGTVPFPTQGSYIVPARSRTASTAGEYVPRKLLRTLSTMSIHESVEGIAGGLAAMGPYIAEKETGADAPASEMPRDFMEEKSEESGGKTDGCEVKEDDSGRKEVISKKKEKRFILF